ncbi:MAG: response regulator [Hormoscilla sp.]
MTASTKQLVAELDSLNQQRATGDLVISNSALSAKLHLVGGRLLYATGGSHRVRRWERASKQHAPNWIDKESELQQFIEPWECQLLSEGIAMKQLNFTQAKKIIRAVALEVFFGLAGKSDLSYNWEPGQITSQGLSLGLALSYQEVEQVLEAAARLQQQWVAAGLGKLSPTVAPSLKQQVSPEAFSGMAKYLKGELTLWDIAMTLRKPIIVVTQALRPLAQKGLLQLQGIPDLPVPVQVQPVETPSPAVTEPSVPQPLIACIDDNQVVLETMKKILMPAGYRMLEITDPMRGMAQLAEEKPDLIFLDLVMPNSSGYNVCNFLRNTPVFEKTPIIILTSRDNPIDRTRAQLVGASDFLAKPPEPEKTLQLVTKYLSKVAERAEKENKTTGEMPSFFSSPGAGKASTLRQGATESAE